MLHFLKLLGLAAPLVTTAPVVLVTRGVAPALEQHWWEYATWAAQHSSPTVMKFLQWASTRRDMFPASFCDRFERFHEHAPEHSWFETEDALRMAFGAKWTDIFDLEREPIGSGCIAQVYRGKLRASGELVAVKVIHPHVKRLVEMDLDLLRAGVWLIECVPPLRLLSSRESVSEFATLMKRQLDLQAEAENLVRFADHFRNRRGLRFPKPHMEYTSESVLVESFENGVRFNELSSLVNDKDRRAIARVVLDSYLRMVFLDNFAHGDLHPGNLLFDLDAHENRSRAAAKLATAPGSSNTGVVAIDAGIVTKLEPDDLQNFVELFHAVATGDGYKAGELIVTRSKRPDLGANPSLDQKCNDLESFCRGMEKIVREALSWKLRLEKVHVGALLREVMELCCSHEVKLEGKYASIVISIAVLEGVGRKLDPDLDVLGVALPIIAQSLVRNVWK